MRRQAVHSEDDGWGVQYDDDAVPVAWWPGPDWVIVSGRYGTDDAVSLTGAEAERLLAALTALMAERMDMQTMARGRGGRDGD